MKRFLIVAASLGFVGCGPKAPDYASNAGATAWLAHHNGTIPVRCITELVSKYGDSVVIDDKARSEARERAMQIAGETYAISLASEKLMVALEAKVAIEEEGFSKGFVTEQAVLDAKTELNEAIFDRQMSRVSLAGLNACEFTATDSQFGFEYRLQVRY